MACVCALACVQGEEGGSGREERDTGRTLSLLVAVALGLVLTITAAACLCSGLGGPRDQEAL